MWQTKKLWQELLFWTQIKSNVTTNTIRTTKKKKKKEKLNTKKKAEERPTTHNVFLMIN